MRGQNYHPPHPAARSPRTPPHLLKSRELRAARVLGRPFLSQVSPGGLPAWRILVRFPLPFRLSLLGLPSERRDPGLRPPKAQSGFALAHAAPAALGPIGGRAHDQR